MDFNDALDTFVSRYEAEEHVTNPLLLHSFLSDHCKSNFQKRDIVKRFYVINRKINFYKIYLQNGFDLGEKVIKDNYKNVKNCISLEIYELLSLAVQESIEKNEFLLTKVLCKGCNIEYSDFMWDM